MIKEELSKTAQAAMKDEKFILYLMENNRKMKGKLERSRLVISALIVIVLYLAATY